MDPKLAALLTKIGVQRLDSQDAAIEEATRLIDARNDAKTYSDEDIEKMEQEIAEAKQAKKDMEAEKAKADARADAAETAKADAEQALRPRLAAGALAGLQGVAAALNVKHDGLDLPGLREAIAKTRVDSIEGKPAEYVDALIDIARKDAAEATKRSDAAASRARFQPKQPRKDGDDANRADADNPFYHPSRDGGAT